MLQGSGKQKLGAIANAIGYYAIGLPIGLSLMFAAKMGVLGTCGLQMASSAASAAAGPKPAPWTQPWSLCSDLSL